MASPRLLLVLSLGASLAPRGSVEKGRVVRLRWVMVLLAVGVALDLIVGLALGYVAVQARSAASSAHISRVAAYQLCLANNDAKQADLARWNAILALVRQSPATPMQTAFIEGVEEANSIADAPRNCGKPVR